MEYPQVSVVIATLNSEKTLLKALESIRKQSYPSDKIEILDIDGGSKDRTLEIAKKYKRSLAGYASKCRILKNPKVDQVYAKHLGWLNSKGKYTLLLDSDEALGNRNSIRNKVLTILNDKRVKAVISSGYESSNTGFQLNSYINEFGDPFSFFLYRISKDEKFFLKELMERSRIVYENSKAAIFDFSGLSNPPFIELTSMGVLIDREYIKSNFREVFENISAHTHLFYLLNSGKCLFAIMKHDPIIHRPVYSLFSYLKKINSRIKNNIYETSMGHAGFIGREKYQPSWYKIKKFLFILYNLLVLPVLLDSLFLSVKRRKPIYLMHVILSFYTLFAIVFYYLLKAFGIKVKLAGYGT